MTAADKIAEARALIEPLTGHTPGPWSNDGYNVLRSVGFCDDESAVTISQLGWFDIPSGWAGFASVVTVDEDGPSAAGRANAALIAASPALRDTVADLADLADALAQENSKLRKQLAPEWFYSADGYESEACRQSVGEVLEEDYFWARPKTGQHVVEINVATALPSIWAAVRFKCECADPDECECDCDNDMIVTEHASEAEARAALGETP